MEKPRATEQVVTDLMDKTAEVLVPRLTEEQLTALKRRLLLKGRELSEILSALMAGQKPGALNLLVAKPGETPIEKVRRYLDLVDGRIKAVAAGTYGRCLGCDAMISHAELTEIPWMDLCARCAAPA